MLNLRLPPPSSANGVLRNEPVSPVTRTPRPLHPGSWGHPSPTTHVLRNEPESTPSAPLPVVCQTNPSSSKSFIINNLQAEALLAGGWRLTADG